MVITCPKCVDGIVDGVTCGYCGGDTKIYLLDAKFKELAATDFRELTGQVWSAIFDKLDALQADMDIIKPQIQACYDDVL